MYDRGNTLLLQLQVLPIMPQTPQLHLLRPPDFSLNPQKMWEMCDHFHILP
jgi:hypothetical protein